eukprot:1159201-Pelagomonas_calceolata.AAC.1
MAGNAFALSALQWLPVNHFPMPCQIDTNLNNLPFPPPAVHKYTHTYLNCAVQRLPALCERRLQQGAAVQGDVLARTRGQHLRIHMQQLCIRARIMRFCFMQCPARPSPCTLVWTAFCVHEFHEPVLNLHVHIQSQFICRASCACVDSTCALAHEQKNLHVISVACKATPMYLQGLVCMHGQQLCTYI